MFETSYRHDVVECRVGQSGDDLKGVDMTVRLACADDWLAGVCGDRAWLAVIAAIGRVEGGDSEFEVESMHIIAAPR